MQAYDYKSTLGEGAYGTVWRCSQVATGVDVAVKCFKQAHEVPEIMKLAMREVRVLRGLDHPGVVKLLDAFRSKTGRVYMLCDFGFARVTRCGPREMELLSSYVVTRWYRAPEVLVGDSYGPAADVWSLGCAMAELATGLPIFQGRSSADQLWRIMRCFGSLTPHQARLMQANEQLTAEGLTVPPRGRTLRERLPPPRVDPSLFQFLEACLRVEPRSRPTAAELLQMPFFWSAPKLLAPAVKAEYDAWEAQQRLESKRQRAEEEAQPHKESRSEAVAPAPAPAPARALAPAPAEPAVELQLDEAPAHQEKAAAPSGPDPPSAQLVLIATAPAAELQPAEPSPPPAASMGVGIVVDVAALGTQWAGPSLAEDGGLADGCSRMDESTTAAVVVTTCDEAQGPSDATAPATAGASDSVNAVQGRAALKEAVALATEEDSQPRASTDAAAAAAAAASSSLAAAACSSSAAERAGNRASMRNTLSVVPNPINGDSVMSALAAVISPPGLFAHNRRNGLQQLQEASTSAHQPVGSQSRWPLFRRAQTLSAANTAPVVCVPTEVDPLRVSNCGGGVLIGGGGGGLLSQAFSGAQGWRATLQAGPGPVVGVLGNAASGSQLPAESCLSNAGSGAIRDIFSGGLGPLFDSPAVERYAHTDSANRARLNAGPLAPVAGRALGGPGGRIAAAAQGTFAYTPEVLSRVSIASSAGTSRMFQEAYMQGSASGYTVMDIGALTSPTDARQAMVRMSSSGVSEQSRRAVAAAVAAAASLWAMQDSIASPKCRPDMSTPGDEQLSSQLGSQHGSQHGSQQNSSGGNTSHGARAQSKGASGRLYGLERATSLGGAATATQNVHSHTHSTSGRPPCPHADLLLSAGGRPRVPAANPPTSRLASHLLKRSGTFATTSCPTVNPLPIMDATVDEPIEEERSSGNHVPLMRSVTSGQAVSPTGEVGALAGTSAPTPSSARGAWESPEVAVAAAESLRWRQSVGRQSNLGARAATRSRSRLGGALSTDTAKSSAGMTTPKEGSVTGPMAVSLDAILLVDDQPSGAEAAPMPMPMPPPSRCQVAMRPDSFGCLAPPTASLIQARADHTLGSRYSMGELGIPTAEHEPASAEGRLQGLKRRLLRSKSGSKATEQQVSGGDGGQGSEPKLVRSKALRALRRLWKRVMTAV